MDVVIASSVTTSHPAVESQLVVVVSTSTTSVGEGAVSDSDTLVSVTSDSGGQ